ncbi:MAG: lysophospholipid acyltransferase family protein [Crocinitomicaceae bacterium]
MLYHILKFIISIGIRIYYKEIKVVGREHIPKKGPLIIAANHPNTLMDAWMIGMICKQPIYYMTKATFFSTRFKRRLLTSLKMVPINRAHEGRQEGVDNKASFEACYQLLENEKFLVIFPEGTSFKERVLRKLKSGTARIALETENRNNFELGLKIVTVGINYAMPERFQSRILVSISEPFEVKDMKEKYAQNPTTASKEVTEKIRANLEKVLATTLDKEHDQITENLYDILSIQDFKNLSRSKGVANRISKVKEISNRLQELEVSEPWKVYEIKYLAKKINFKLKKLHLKTMFVEKGIRKGRVIRELFWSMLLIILFFPLFIYGLFFNFIPYKLVDWLVPKISKDVEYFAPLAIILSGIIYPIYYFGVVYAVVNIFDLIFFRGMIFMISLPISGIFAYTFKKNLDHVAYKWNYLFLLISRKDIVRALDKDIKQLKAYIFN